MSQKPKIPEPEEQKESPEMPPAETSDVHDGRRFQVSNQRGKARTKVRYVEGTQPKGGCRFLS